MRIEVRFPTNPFHPIENNDEYFNACKIIAEMESAKIQDEGSYMFLFEYRNDIPIVSLEGRDCQDEKAVRLQSLINERLLGIYKSDKSKFASINASIKLYELIKDLPQTNKIRDEIKAQIASRKEALRACNVPFIHNPSDVNNLFFLLMAVISNQIPLETAWRVQEILESEVEEK